MTPVCSAYDRPRENQTGLAVRPVANVALDTNRAITEGIGAVRDCVTAPPQVHVEGTA